MTSDFFSHLKKVRLLSVLLVASCILNVCLLSLFLFWILKETPPTPYCELQPASSSNSEESFTEKFGCQEVLMELSQLSFLELVDRLSNQEMVENGLTERDLSLSCLMGLHHFDVERALLIFEEPKEIRSFSWKVGQDQQSIVLPLCFGLTDSHFEVLIDFAKNEEFPFTSEGLFKRLKQEGILAEESKLRDTFSLTPEFWTVEHLFSRAKVMPSQQELITLILEGSWDQLNTFVQEQKQLNDTSDKRRVAFLLDYIRAHSSQACVLMLKNEEKSWIKKFSDDDVIDILKCAPISLEDGEKLAQEMLISPRSQKVWQQAVLFLYAKLGENPPSQLSLDQALARFSHLNKAILQSPKEPSKMKDKSILRQEEKKIVPTANAVQKPSKPPERKKQEVSSPRQLTYIVQEGDNLWKIAGRFGLNVDELKKLNHLNSNSLKPGITLQLPPNKEKKN